MATLPMSPEQPEYPSAGYPYQPRAVEQRPMPGVAARPPMPPRSMAGAPEQRLSKPQALTLVRDLKKVALAGAVLTFGAFGVLIAGRLNTTNAASTSGTDNGVSNGSSNGSLFGGDDNGGYFGQQNDDGGSGNFGGSFNGGGFNNGPVTGSSVS